MASLFEIEAAVVSLWQRREEVGTLRARPLSEDADSLTKQCQWTKAKILSALVGDVVRGGCVFSFFLFLFVILFGGHL